MKILRTFALSLVMSLCGIMTANATELSDGEIIYSYNNTGSSVYYGTGKKENYDVAIHLTGADLIGTTVTKVILPFEGIASVSNVKVWLSKELTLETIDGKKTNVPDIQTQDVDFTTGTIEVTLSTPYTIDADGVYVGYSFNIDELNDYSAFPVAVCSATDEGGFYIHSSRTYRSWMSIVSQIGDLAMEVVLDNVPSDAAGVTVPESIDVQGNRDNTVEMTVLNHGYNGVSSFEYTYTVGGTTTTNTVDLGDNALAARYNVSTTVNIPLPEFSVSGAYPLNVKITKVNGTDNTDPTAEATATVNVFDVLPTHRAVLEEYTGTWCGNCPRGFVALEVMNRLYPDDFIAISYHNSDPMEIMAISLYPNDVSGFPAGYLDRAYEADPYYGFTNSGFGIETAWKEVCEQIAAPADIDVTATLSDDAKYVNIDASTIFAADYTAADYKIEFVLLADSLQGTGNSWMQSNYYAGGSLGTFSEPEFQQFMTGSAYVSGLKYNDVIIATSRLTNEDVALPSAITAATYMDTSYTFDLSTAISTSGENLVQDVNNLRVVALLIDNATGAIANANKAKVINTTGIKGITTTSPADGNAEFYDVNGRRHSSAFKGLNIIKTANGKVIKVMRK